MQELPNSAEVHLGKAIASLNDETFETCLYHWLSRSIEVDNTTMIAYFQQHQPRVLFAHAYERRVHAKLDSDYVSGAYLLDPFHALHVEKAPEDLYQLREIAPDQFQRNEYFAAYYQQTTLIDEIAFIGYPADGVSVHICLGRDAMSRRRFSVRDVATARRLAPIVCGMIRQRWSDLRSSGDDYSDQALVERLTENLLITHGIKLSPRQAEIALLILRGHSSVSIGLRLEISSQTVKVFRKQLYRKCSISSQAELFSLIMPLLSESASHKPR